MVSSIFQESVLVQNNYSVLITRKKHFMFGNQERMPLTWTISEKEDINYVVLSSAGFNNLQRNKIPIL